MMPQRIQRKRTKGWRMPEGAVYVGRPTKWGNPYRVERDPRGWVTRSDTAFIGTFPGIDAARRYAALAYQAWWGERPASNEEIRAELAGRDLCCWCPLEDEAGNHVPCHADVLLELANDQGPADG